MVSVDIQVQLERLVADPLQPGAVVALQRASKLELFAAGHMEREHRRVMRPDAIFRISSMSKPIVAVALLQLVQDGVVKLDDPVARWLPELADPRVLERIDAPLHRTVSARSQITVEHLLSSRMGTGILAMPSGATPIQQAIERLDLPGFGPDNPASPIDQDQWLELLSTLPLLAEPGTEWFYNTSTYVQGVLISRLAGRPLSEQLAERIFTPLGMLDTGFVVPPSKQDRLTTSYSGGLVETDSASASAWSRFPALEASLVATAADYAAFARMLQRAGMGDNGEVIDEALVRMMLSDKLSPAQREGASAFLDGRGWGYGVSVDPGRQLDGTWSGEIGWAGGLGSSWTSRLDNDASIVILGCRAIDHADVMAAHVDLTRSALEADG